MTSNSPGPYSNDVTQCHMHISPVLQIHLSLNCMNYLPSRLAVKFPVSLNGIIL